MISTAIQKFKEIDFLGAKFELNIKGNSRYTTLLGVCMSMLCLIVLSLGIYAFLGNLIDKSSPEVTINSQIQKAYPLMTLYEESLVPGFGIFSESSGYIPAEQISDYITVFAFVQVIEYDVVQAFIPTVNNVTIPFVPCKLVAIPNILKIASKDKTASEFIQKHGICPNITDPSAWSVQGMLSDPPFQYIQIHILPCMTIPGRVCKNINELIDMKIKSGLVEKTVEFSEHNDPLKFDINLDREYYINPAQISGFVHFFKTNKVEDDEFDFIPPTEVTQFIDEEKVIATTGFRNNQIECSITELTEKTCIPYIYFDLRSGAKIQTIQRRYDKIFATIAEIGGFTELIILVFGMVYICYNDYFFKRFMKKEVLRIKENSVSQIFEDKGKDPNSKEGNQEDVKEVKKLLEDMVDRDFDAISLFKEMNNFSILEKLLFQEHHKTLLPLVVIGIKNEKKAASKKKKRMKKNNKKTSESLQLGGDATEEQDFYSYDEIVHACKELLNDEPQNEIEQIVKEFFIKNIPVNVKSEASNNP